MTVDEREFLELLRTKAESWLADGGWVGVFENQDLGHHEVGRRVAIPYPEGEYAKAEVGSCRAPDHPSIGLGWRYLLVAKCRTVEDVLKEMGHDGN